MPAFLKMPAFHEAVSKVHRGQGRARAVHAAAVRCYAEVWDLLEALLFLVYYFLVSLDVQSNSCLK